VGKPTHRKAGQAPHLDSICVTVASGYDSTAGYFTSLFSGTLLISENCAQRGAF